MLFIPFILSALTLKVASYVVGSEPSQVKDYIPSERVKGIAKRESIAGIGCTELNLHGNCIDFLSSEGCQELASNSSEFFNTIRSLEINAGKQCSLYTENNCNSTDSRDFLIFNGPALMGWVGPLLDYKIKSVSC
jgi:hypothetical protein